MLFTSKTMPCALFSPPEAHSAHLKGDSTLNTDRPDQKNHYQCMKKNRFFSPKEFSAHLNSSHFLTLGIAMQKVECKIKPYFNYPEKNGKSLVQ